MSRIVPPAVDTPSSGSPPRSARTIATGLVAGSPLRVKRSRPTGVSGRSTLASARATERARAVGPGDRGEQRLGGRGTVDRPFRDAPARAGRAEVAHEAPAGGREPVDGQAGDRDVDAARRVADRIEQAADRDPAEGGEDDRDLVPEAAAERRDEPVGPGLQVHGPGAGRLDPPREHRDPARPGSLERRPQDRQAEAAGGPPEPDRRRTVVRELVRDHEHAGRAHALRMHRGRGRLVVVGRA